MNERLLRDGCEAIALVGGLSGDPSSQAVRLWLEFIATPTPSHWYRAHNASIVAGYLEREGLAEEESAPERFFMNVALARALRTRPRCAPAPGAGALRSAGPHVEHAAPPAAEHLGQEPSRQRHERAAVELDLMADLLRIPVDEAARIRNAGVVDQPADTPWAAGSSSAICSRRSGYPAKPSAAARPTPPTPRVMRRGRLGWPELRPRRSAALTSLARTRRDPR
jgi:hypothetical protein